MATLLGDDVRIMGEDILGEDILGEDILGEDILGEDILGEDLLGEDLLGVDWAKMAKMGGRAALTAGTFGANRAAGAAYGAWKRAQMAKRMARAAKGNGMLVRKAPPLISKVPGVSTQTSQVKIPLGFGSVNFAASALANGASIAQSATATPQVPVRGGRLILNRYDTPVVSGTSTAACSILVTNILVGQQSVFASAQGVPVEAFGPTATDTTLTIPAAQPGVVITAQYTLTNATGGALGAGASATVAGVLICDSIAG